MSLTTERTMESESTGFNEWIDSIRVTLRAQDQKAQIRRDHFAYLIGLFWDGTTPEEAVTWLGREHCLVPLTTTLA